ncbi:transaldolase family protein [Stigmatella sp. ncwal1]|uniref:Transaldolase family protein n=1 Tax=Stigmatella ashevillensis TaxID=2995309 RepID=A0ABT5D9B8_9BACT|nr:transaldolase family protein [Stigmatella ashevillena]MDC0710272.1 transaldolase family protein [Stigmatella ashevillena]
MPASRMQQTVALGTEFWSDSCALPELAEAIGHGASGATSNPVIVGAAVSADPAKWLPVLQRLLREHPADTEDDAAWRLIEAVAKEAAALLAPLYDRTGGRQGYLSVQVSPKLYRSTERMIAHGLSLAALAPNIALKCPSTKEGIAAMEELTARGINVNATVSFTVSQALATAEALERGIDRALREGFSRERLHPYVTIMVGRVDDHMKRVAERDSVPLEPGCLDWAGIAVFKKAHQLFLQRRFRSTLLSAAYRHSLHWSELIGEGVIQSIPYAWWKQFNGSDLTPRQTLTVPVAPGVVETLHHKLPDFRRAYDEEGMRPEAFAAYGASVHTLRQFLGGNQQLVEWVRDQML